MRTRTFPALILLVLGLMMVSTPALLDPAAERVALLAGVDAHVASPVAAGKDDEKAKPLDPRLELRGHVVTKNAVRDQYEGDARDSSATGRLSSAGTRLALPGQAPAVDPLAPPYAATGPLLDVDGCPLFHPGDDVARLLADPKVVNVYAGKVAASDDPAACTRLFKERAAAAVKPPDVRTPAFERQVAAVRRGDQVAALVFLEENAMMGAMFDLEDLDARLADAVDPAG